MPYVLAGSNFVLIIIIIGTGIMSCFVVAAHQYHVALESSSSKLPVVSYGKIQVTFIGENNVNETFTLTKKDDEELGVGTTLSKIVVPHPALQGIVSIQIMYSAYSGWISSGLKKWSIDRIKITDSFGKSMSVCKKDLILESGEPVTLKIYPGECNLPKDIEATTIDPFFLPEPEKNRTEIDVSTNKTVDGYPAYTVFGGLLKNISIDSIVPKIFVRNAAYNKTEILRKNEIEEPVLHPKIKDFKVEEMKLVRPRDTSGVNGTSSNSSWMPPVDLFPPPLGGKQLWETSREPKRYQDISPPKTIKNSGTVTTLQTKLLNKTRSGSKQRMYNYAPKNENRPEGVVTVQLLPQNLANFLKQAEQYAKMSLFSPLDIFYRNRNNTKRGEKHNRLNEKRNIQNETKIEEKKEVFVGTPRSLDSNKPKNLIPRIYEYFEKGFENVRSLFRWDGNEEQHLDVPENRENSTLVPYYYHQTPQKYIPLSSNDTPDGR